MRQPVKSKLFPDSADNFCLNKNFHHTIFGLDVSKSIPNLPTCADRPLHCKWAFKKIEAFKKILYPLIEQCSKHNSTLEIWWHVQETRASYHYVGKLEIRLENQMVCAILFGKCQKLIGCHFRPCNFYTFSGQFSWFRYTLWVILPQDQHLMGLTDRRKKAQKLVDSCKNWKILTISRK